MILKIIIKFLIITLAFSALPSKLLLLAEHQHFHDQDASNQNL